MSYLKLCQLIKQSESEVFYQEDADGHILVNHPVYPLVLDCEVINFESEAEFHKRGKASAFEAEEVIINVAPEAGQTIRQVVFLALQSKYPTLVV